MGGAHKSLAPFTNCLFALFFGRRMTDALACPPPVGVRMVGDEQPTRALYLQGRSDQSAVAGRQKKLQHRSELSPTFLSAYATPTATACSTLPTQQQPRHAVAQSPTAACLARNCIAHPRSFSLPRPSPPCSPAATMSGARPHGPVKEQMVDLLPKRFKGIKFGIQCV